MTDATASEGEILYTKKQLSNFIYEWNNKQSEARRRKGAALTVWTAWHAAVRTRGGGRERERPVHEGGREGETRRGQGV